MYLRVTIMLTVSITVDQSTINKLYDVCYDNFHCQLSSLQHTMYTTNKFYDIFYDNHHCQLQVLQ